MSIQLVDNNRYDPIPVESVIQPDGSRRQIVTLRNDEAIKIDDDGGTTVYRGFADVGSLGSESVWKIHRESVTGDVTSIEWADGDAEYDNVWDDRESLTYS